jgi:ribonuclease P protein component
MKKARGPLVVFTMPNGRAFHRLGLSIGKRVGGATERNRVKRMIREAFRLSQHALPLLGGAGSEAQGGMDIVVSAQAHHGLALEQYQTLLSELVALARKDWSRRQGYGGAHAGPA